MQFVPDIALFEAEALRHPRGRAMRRRLRRAGVARIETLPSHNRVPGLPGRTAQAAYRQGKRTLVIRMRRDWEFVGCRPSADYQLPLVGGCPGLCQYCYLITRFGRRPYLQVYANVGEILERADAYVRERRPEKTTFEGSAVSDPVPVERYTGALAETVRWAAAHSDVPFRFATKYTDVDFLQSLPHEGKTTVRFSLNTPEVIRQYERGTPGLERRLAAARRVQRFGYPLGFLIAPIIFAGNWRDQYGRLLQKLQSVEPPFTLELITHRFTEAARDRIQEIFPNTTLPLDRNSRRLRRGRFGHGKYVYPAAVMEQIRQWFDTEVGRQLPGVQILYTV